MNEKEVRCATIFERRRLREIDDYLTERDNDMTVPFGRYKGYSIRSIPDDYLFWLCSRGKSTYYVSKHSLDVSWKVPFYVWEEARKEAERRGFQKIGERWERI